MKRLLFVCFCSLVFAPHLMAAELVTATRADFDVAGFRYALRGELKRAVNDYRVAVNQTGITPSQERQMRAERERIMQWLKSRGYYQATIEATFDDDRNKPQYSISLGKLTKINNLTVTGDFTPQDTGWRQLKAGDDLNAIDVLAEQARLRNEIEQASCFYRVQVNHEVRFTPDPTLADIHFIVVAQQAARFSTIRFEGEHGFDPLFLQRVTGIRTGDCYSRQTIDDAVFSLFDLGVFSSVRPTSEYKDGLVEVVFNVQKRKLNTLSAGAGWQTDLEWGAKAGWQQRDLFGEAQSLSLQASWQTNQRSLNANLQVPSFFDRRNRLQWQNSVVHGLADIETMRYSSSATIERRASSDDYFEYGLGYSQLNEKQDNGDWTYYRQIRMPLQYRYDSVADPFNPTGGIRWLFDVEPVWDIDEDLTPFVLTGVGLHVFSELDSAANYAGRVRWSSLWYGDDLGSTVANIPDTEWLRAGGSSSIRGYSYQSIYLDPEAQSSNAGATQRWLISNELRLRLNDSWGVVAFSDVGSVSQQANPLEQSQWLAGLGLGVRYFTRFAPLRVDVAVPTNARESDESFLVYVSLGQAF